MKPSASWKFPFATAVLFFISPAAFATVLNGTWALDTNAAILFTETNLTITAKDQFDNDVIIKADGPYELRADTLIWFEKYGIRDTLSKGTSDTLLFNKQSIANVDSFYLGINLNGPDVRIGNEGWSGSQKMINDSSLKIFDFGYSGPVSKQYSNIAGANGDSLAMLQSAFENNPAGDGIVFSIAIPDTQTHYRVYLWYCRPDSITNKPGDFRVGVGTSNIYDGTPNLDTVITEVGNWRRIGPYHTDSRSVLDIDAMTQAHNPGDVRRVSLSGIEIKKGPSIKDVNTFRYLYRIVDDSLYLSPVKEMLFNSIGLQRVQSGIKGKGPNNTFVNVIGKKENKTCYDILGRKVAQLKNYGVYLSAGTGKEGVRKIFYLKSTAGKK